LIDFCTIDVKQLTWIPRTLIYTGTGSAGLWEASMHSGFRSHRKEGGFFERWGFGFVVLPVLLAVTMVVLWVVQPNTNNLIADIVQEMGMRTATAK
jgi:hypothetical protein